MIKKLMSGVLAGALLVGASNVMAEVLDLFDNIWVIAGVQSSSGQVEKQFEEKKLGPDDLCMVGVQALRDLGFSFKAKSQVEPKLTAMYFQKPDDAAVLFCALILTPNLNL